MVEKSSTTASTEESPSCTLTETAQQVRAQWARKEVFPHYREGELLPDGFQATFKATEASLTAVNRLFAREAECCASLTFELTYEPPYETFQVRVTGPDGTRDLLRRGLVEEFETVSGPNRWLADSGALDAPLPEDMQTALGRLIGEESVETLEGWVTVIRQHTDGPSMVVDDLCHDSEPTGHRAVMAEETYHFKCFYDAVVLAAISDEPVDIRTESPDGEVIRARAAGSDELTVTPSDAVFSLGVTTDATPTSDGDLALDDVYGAVCPYVKAFPNRTAYTQWASDVPAATVAMPLAGATDVAEALLG